MKITPEQIVQIAADYFTGVSRKELADKYQVSERTIGHLIASGKWAQKKKEIAKSCTNIAVKTTTDNFKKNAQDLSEQYVAVVERNINRLVDIEKVADVAVKNALYTGKGKLKKKPDINQVVKAMELQRAVKNEYRDTIAEGNWSILQKEFDKVISLHDLMERMVKHGSKIFVHPDKLISRVLDVMYKKEHVEAMKYNTVPFRVVDMLMAVQTDIIKNFISETEEPEKFAEAMKFVDMQNEKIQPYMDK